MRTIKDFWMKKKGKDAYLLGTGPSLADFVHNFDFSKKVDLFCINYAFTKVDIEYVNNVFIQEYETYLNIRKHFDDEKLIIPNLTGLNKFNTDDRVKVEDSKSIAYELHTPYNKKIEDLPNKDYSLDKDIKVFSYTATIQSAIHILAYMGYKNIYLVGVDYKKYPNGNVHFNTLLDKRYSEQTQCALSRHKEGMDYLITELMRRHNIIIKKWND